MQAINDALTLTDLSNEAFESNNGKHLLASSRSVV